MKFFGYQHLFFHESMLRRITFIGKPTGIFSYVVMDETSAEYTHVHDNTVQVAKDTFPVTRRPPTVRVII
jgi:hypothetical protein